MSASLCCYWSWSEWFRELDWKEATPAFKSSGWFSSLNSLSVVLDRCQWDGMDPVWESTIGSAQLLWSSTHSDSKSVADFSWIRLSLVSNTGFFHCIFCFHPGQRGSVEHLQILLQYGGVVKGLEVASGETKGRGRWGEQRQTQYVKVCSLLIFVL